MVEPKGTGERDFDGYISIVGVLSFDSCVCNVVLSVFDCQVSDLNVRSPNSMLFVSISRFRVASLDIELNRPTVRLRCSVFNFRCSESDSQKFNV